MRQRRPAIRRRGFTLIEVISSAVILAALGSIGASILFVAIDGYNQGSTVSRLHNKASLALERIVREIGTVAIDPEADTLAPDIESVDTDAITWNDTSMLLLFDGRLHLRLDGGLSYMLVDEVSEFQIMVFDQDDAPLSLPRSDDGCDVIRRIAFSITLADSGLSETVRTKQFLRCTMSRAGTP
jgi:prepilin-type N-terminal cleavage/methylation domain-containing protein